MGKIRLSLKRLADRRSCPLILFLIRKVKTARRVLDFKAQESTPQPISGNSPNAKTDKIGRLSCGGASWRVWGKRTISTI